MIEGQNISNVQPIQNNLNQSVNLANDPELYPTMKKVIEKSKEKVLFDNKKEEQEKLEEEEKAKEKEKEKESIPKSGSISAKRKIDYTRLNDEFKDIFNKENANINDTRRNLIHLIILTAVVNCITWEIDCLFLNACYDEYIEMIRWISRSLFPCIIISIILLYLIYVSVNYLKKIPFIICIIIYALLSIYIFVFGVISLAKGSKREIDSTIIKDLTRYEILYYNNGSENPSKEDAENSIKNKFKFKMVFTGVLDLVISLLGAIVVITSVVFNSYLSQTTFDWRPPLRSHVRISRIKKAIELYTQNSESFINVFRAENPHYQFDGFENKDKDMNRFGRVRGMMEGSMDQSREKKDNSNSIVQNRNNNNNIDNENDINNNEEEIFLPKARKRKLKNINNIESNNDDKNNIKNEKENEINTNSNNIINNKVENNEDNKEESKEEKKEDNKEDI